MTMTWALLLSWLALIPVSLSRPEIDGADLLFLILTARLVWVALRTRMEQPTDGPMGPHTRAAVRRYMEGNTDGN